jgi:hypothetical protein
VKAILICINTIINFNQNCNLLLLQVALFLPTSTQPQHGVAAKVGGHFFSPLLSAQ